MAGTHVHIAYSSHMWPRVAEVRETDGRLAECPDGGRRAEPRAGDLEGPAPPADEPDEEPAHDRNRAGDANGWLPRQPIRRPDGADEVRQSGADGEGADQHADGEPALPPKPAGEHLHGDGIDRGQTGARESPPGQSRNGIAGESGESQVADSRHERTGQEEPRAGDDVSGASERKDDGGHREAQLDGDGEQGQLETRRVPQAPLEQADRPPTR